jgi:hypothetical protein
MGLFEGNAPPYAAPYAALYAGNLAEPYSPMDKLPKQDVGLSYQVCRPSLPAKSAGQVCQPSLPAKSACQVCRPSLLK